MNKKPKIHYQSEASVIKPIIKKILNDFGIYPEMLKYRTMTNKIVTAVLKAQRKHNHEVIGEE